MGSMPAALVTSYIPTTTKTFYQKITKELENISNKRNP